ncbi:hypothetical protein VTJ04DRAFT_1210 [Mycothermus thermophilus]|uniref:uncharacterized protein n=1 Tax=Humicola insolens TaxID=85995 RepID=UPI0037420761
MPSAPKLVIAGWSSLGSMLRDQSIFVIEDSQTNANPTQNLSPCFCVLSKKPTATAINHKHHHLSSLAPLPGAKTIT